MTGVSVGEATALWIKDAIEAGDEHVGWDVGKERLVDPLEHLARRGIAPGCKAQHAAGRGHNQRCGHPLPWHPPLQAPLCLPRGGGNRRSLLLPPWLVGSRERAASPPVRAPPLAGRLAGCASLP